MNSLFQSSDWRHLDVGKPPQRHGVQRTEGRVNTGFPGSTDRPGGTPTTLQAGGHRFDPGTLHFKVAAHGDFAFLGGIQVRAVVTSGMPVRGRRCPGH
jgi:hypothetical protein